jgi:hypothetical protein
MSTQPETDETGTFSAARALDLESRSGTHPGWCRFERPGALGGVEHVSGPVEWHPTYMSDVAVIGWLRHVSYPDGTEETPVVVLQVDNPEQPGEFGMTAEDLASLADRLLALRADLLE